MAEGEVNSNDTRYYIHRSEWDTDSQYRNERQASDSGEIRKSSQGIPSQRDAGIGAAIRHQQLILETYSGSGRGSESKDGAINSDNGREVSHNGSLEARESDGMGSSNEQYKSDGRGDSN